MVYFILSNRDFVVIVLLQVLYALSVIINYNSDLKRRNIMNYDVWLWILSVLVCLLIIDRAAAQLKFFKEFKQQQKETAQRRAEIYQANRDMIEATKAEAEKAENDKLRGYLKKLTDYQEKNSFYVSIRYDNSKDKDVEQVVKHRLTDLLELHISELSKEEVDKFFYGDYGKLNEGDVILIGTSTRGPVFMEYKYNLFKKFKGEVVSVEANLYKLTISMDENTKFSKHITKMVFDATPRIVRQVEA